MENPTAFSNSEAIWYEKPSQRTEYTKGPVGFFFPKEPHKLRTLVEVAAHWVIKTAQFVQPVKETSDNASEATGMGYLPFCTADNSTDLEIWPISVIREESRDDDR